MASSAQAIPTATPTVTVTPGSTATPTKSGVIHEATVNLGAIDGEASQTLGKLVDLSGAIGMVDAVVTCQEGKYLKFHIGNQGGYLMKGGCHFFYGVSPDAKVEWWMGGKGKLTIYWWTKK